MLVDPRGLRVSQVWRPLGHGAWPAGYHTAINVNGRIYGFGPNGVVEENPDSYGWGSHEVVIHEGNEIDKAYLGYLQNAADGHDPRFRGDMYNVVKENCMTFAEAAKKDALFHGIQINIPHRSSGNGEK